MKTALCAALAAATTLMPAARADAPSAIGTTCGASYDDTGFVYNNPHAFPIEIDGGPLIAADLPNGLTWDVDGNPATAVVTCAIQVGGTGLFTEADATSVSASGTPMAYLAPTIRTVDVQTFNTQLWLCTTWTLTDAHGNRTVLYDDSVSGDFITNVAAAHCGPLGGESVVDRGVEIIQFACTIVPPACERVGRNAQ